MFILIFIIIKLFWFDDVKLRIKYETATFLSYIKVIRIVNDTFGNVNEKITGFPTAFFDAVRMLLSTGDQS